MSNNKGRYIYHYCAMRQGTIGEINYTDGIAQMEEKIVNMDDYRSFKELIEKDRDITITSLSFIGMEFDE